MTFSTVFLVLLFLMIAVYAWKAPRRIEIAQLPIAPPAPIPAKTTIAEKVVADIALQNIPEKVAAAPFHPVAVTPEIVAFKDKSTMEKQGSDWVARPSSHAEQVLSILWRKKCLREYTTMLLQEIKDAVDFEIKQDTVQQTMSFPDGTAIFYNRRVHSWMIDMEVAECH